MKKVLISLLLVLLTICLFVSCKPDPKTKAYVAKVTFNSIGEDGDEPTALRNGDYYIKRPSSTDETIKLYSDEKCTTDSGYTITLAPDVDNSLQINVFQPGVFGWTSVRYYDPDSEGSRKLTTGISSEIETDPPYSATISFSNSFNQTFEKGSDYLGTVSIVFSESCTLVAVSGC